MKLNIEADVDVYCVDCNEALVAWWCGQWIEVRPCARCVEEGYEKGLHAGREEESE